MLAIIEGLQYIHVHTGHHEFLTLKDVVSLLPSHLTIATVLSKFFRVGRTWVSFVSAHIRNESSSSVRTVGYNVEGTTKSDENSRVVSCGLLTIQTMARAGLRAWSDGSNKILGPRFIKKKKINK